MRKILCFLISAVLVFTLVSCSSDPTGEEDASSKGSTEQTIVDQSGVTVSYEGMELVEYAPGQKDGFELCVKLKIVNTTDASITVYPEADKSSVNDVMKMAMSAVPMTVASGKTLNASMVFTMLSDCGISSVDDIGSVSSVEFTLYAENNDTGEQVFESGPIKVAP